MGILSWQLMEEDHIVHTGYQQFQLDTLLGHGNSELKFYKKCYSHMSPRILILPEGKAIKNKNLSSRMNGQQDPTKMRSHQEMQVNTAVPIQ